MTEELRERAAEWLWRCWSKSDLDWEHARQKGRWYKKADNLVEWLGLVDSEGAKMPKNPHYPHNLELLGGRPVERLK